MRVWVGLILAHYIDYLPHFRDLLAGFQKEFQGKKIRIIFKFFPSMVLNKTPFNPFMTEAVII